MGHILRSHIDSESSDQCNKTKETYLRQSFLHILTKQWFGTWDNLLFVLHKLIIGVYIRAGDFTTFGLLTNNFFLKILQFSDSRHKMIDNTPLNDICRLPKHMSWRKLTHVHCDMTIILL